MRYTCWLRVAVPGTRALRRSGCLPGPPALPEPTTQPPPAQRCPGVHPDGAPLLPPRGHLPGAGGLGRGQRVLRCYQGFAMVLVKGLRPQPEGARPSASCPMHPCTQAYKAASFYEVYASGERLVFFALSCCCVWQATPARAACGPCKGSCTHQVCHPHQCPALASQPSCDSRAHPCLCPMMITCPLSE